MVHAAREPAEAAAPSCRSCSPSHRRWTALSSPLEFADPARSVFQCYVSLAQLATSVARRRNPRLRTERWVPAVELLVEVGGAALSVVPGLLGRDPAACRVAGRVSRRPGDPDLPLSLKLVMRGLARRGSRADLGITVPVLQGRLEDAAVQWGELLAGLGQAQAADRAAGTLIAERLAALERPRPGPS